jgi:hypothetical protein
MLAFAADVRRRFEQRLGRMLLRRYAPPVPPPPGRVEAFVTAGVDRAMAEGFVDSDEIALFVAVSWSSGEDFHRHPPFARLDARERVRWMRRTLGEEVEE